MTQSKVIQTQWYPEKQLIVTQISGEVDQSDIGRWENSLQSALGQLKDGAAFKILVNLHGFKAADLPAHKRFRNIVPLTLAQYGWKVGYIAMFETEAQTLRYLNTRGIQCTGAAHCHHDNTKMERYESDYSRDQEHFFTDPEQALRWIEGLN
jgi:hypothetical protein